MKETRICSIIKPIQLINPVIRLVKIKKEDKKFLVAHTYNPWTWEVWLPQPGLLFYFYICGCDKKKKISQQTATQKGLILPHHSRSQSVIAGKSSQKLKTATFITCTVKNREVNTFVLSTPAPVFNSPGPKLRDWHCLLSGWLFPHRLRQSEQSPTDLPIGQPGPNSPSLRLCSGESSLCPVDWWN